MPAVLTSCAVSVRRGSHGTLVAPEHFVRGRRFSSVAYLYVVVVACATIPAQPVRVTAYRVEAMAGGITALRQRFSDGQLRTLEKLNRADLEHLGRLPSLVVPDVWAADELAYSVLPARYPSAEGRRKVLVVYAPGQVFGAYESGTLVR